MDRVECINGQPFNRQAIIDGFEIVKRTDRCRRPYNSAMMTSRLRKKVIQRSRDNRVYSILIQALNNAHVLTPGDMRFVKATIRELNLQPRVRRQLQKKLLPFQRASWDTVKLHMRTSEPGHYRVKIIPRSQSVYYIERFKPFRVWF